MALIEETKEGRQDGGYSRIFGNKQIGGLMSKVHATTIRAGNELEKIVVDKHIALMSDAEFELFVHNKPIPGKEKFILTKAIIKNKLKKYIDSKSEPDFVVIVIFEKTCFIIELKDGDTFDTKKSAGEIASLKEFSDKFQKKFNDYKVHVKFCSFNCNNKSSIVAGLKGKITENDAMTGREFCELIHISYENIIEQRKRQAESNLIYFINRLIQIPEIKSIVEQPK